ncbi:MAG: hypothetical protein WCW02_01775 [Candidatus Buchananbacteria bacterium]
MSKYCSKLSAKLETLKALKQEFDQEIVKAQSLSPNKPEDLVLVRDIKAKLNQELKQSQEVIEVFYKIVDWQDFYQEVFELKYDFFDLIIPKKEEGFDRLIIMAPGLTNQQLWDKTSEICKRLAGTLLINFNLFTSERTTKTAYAFWVRDDQEACADESAEFLSVKQVKEREPVAETLEERLLHDLKYLKETGRRLDYQSQTLCSGSVDKFGRMPCIDCNNYTETLVNLLGLDTDLSKIGTDYKRLRARKVIL